MSTSTREIDAARWKEQPREPRVPFSLRLAPWQTTVSVSAPWDDANRSLEPLNTATVPPRDRWRRYAPVP